MKRILAGLLLTWVVGGAARAQDASAGPAPSPPLVETTWPSPGTDPDLTDAVHANLSSRNPFSAGQCDFQFMASSFKKTSLGPGGPGVDYVPLGVRFGWMLTTPCDDHGFLRGNVEALLEAYYAPIVREFGSYITGPDLLIRYNFVQPECLVVPYLQVGAGFAFNDAWRYRQQRLIGEEFEFLLRGEAGARIMLTDTFSFDTEFGYQHISNARLALRNGGINNLGIGIGFTYFFGKMK